MAPPIRDDKFTCADHYRCATALYLLSILSQSFNKIIDRGISVPGHVREVVDDLNDTNKSFIFYLMDTVQLPGGKCFDKKRNYTYQQKYRRDFSTGI